MFTTKVRDAMTSPVITVRPDMPLKEVATLLVRHRISGAPVVDAGGHIVGVISEADFLVKGSGRGAVHHRPLARFVGESEATEAQLAKVGATVARDAMTAPAEVIDPDRPLHAAAERMMKLQINRLPVVEPGGKLVGIVTRADVMRAYARSDEDLARTIRQNIIEVLALAPADVELELDDGIVRVRGTLARRSTVEILERLIGQVDGVVAVQSELAWQLDDRTI